MVYSKIKPGIVDITDAIPDIAENVIYISEFSGIPSGKIEEVIFKALNDLIDNFCDEPEKYLEPRHESEIERTLSVTACKS